MTVRRLDSTGDIKTSGEQFLTGAEEVAQTIKTRLMLFLGEYFRDNTEGSDWFGKILGKGQGLDTAEAEIKKRIVQTQNVLSITGFQTDFDTSTRRMTISASVLTLWGEQRINTGSIV